MVGPCTSRRRPLTSAKTIQFKVNAMKVTSSTGEETQMVLAENAGTGKGNRFLADVAPKYGTRFVTVTQTLPDMERFEAYRRKTAAFEEWRQKLNRGDRLPPWPFF
jgi:hypothetical protein